MRKVFLVLGIVGLLLVAGLISFVVLSTPKEICRPIARWDGAGAGWRLDHPMNLAWQDGILYVAEFYNHRIQKFTADGKFVTQWGRDGRWNGQFHYPTDVAVGATGAVFVADAYNHRIQTFTENGVYVRKWGGMGFGLSGKWSGWFRPAKTVTVDTVGCGYV